MVILQINCNIPQDETSFRDFSGKVTEMLSETLDVNSSFVQIIYNYSQSTFGNQEGPSTLVTLSKNDFNRSEVEAVTSPLSKLLERLIGSPPATTFIQFQSLTDSEIVWNGRPLR